MSSEQYINDVTATLNGTITAGATSVVYSGLSGIDTLPSVGTFSIRIDNELMTVTAINTGTSTMTVTRGEGGTTAASHTSGVVIYFVVSKRALLQMMRDRILSGAYSSEPAAADSGRLYLPNDSPNIDWDTGAAYNTWGPIFPLSRPSDTGFSWVNQNSSTLTTTNGMLTLNSNNNSASGDFIQARVISAPSTPYSITAAFLPCFDYRNNANSMGYGLIWRSSSDSKLTIFGRFTGSTTQNLNMAYDKYTGTSTFSAQYGSQAGMSDTYVRFLKLLDDGTNRKAFISSDGINFVQFGSTVLRTDFHTPDQVGFFINETNLNSKSYVSLIHWKQGTS